jgi:hypothetical protein
VHNLKWPIIQKITYQLLFMCENHEEIISFPIHVMPLSLLCWWWNLMKLWNCDFFLKEKREGEKRKGSPTLILKFCWLKSLKAKKHLMKLFSLNPSIITCVVQSSKFKLVLATWSLWGSYVPCHTHMVSNNRIFWKKILGRFCTFFLAMNSFICAKIK